MSTPLVSTDPKDILFAARCFCLPHFHELALKTYQLNQVVVAASPPCTTPSTPNNLQVNTLVTTLVVRWKQPANHGSLITSYTVCLGTVSGGPYTICQTVGPGPKKATFLGLSPGTTYFAVVTANSTAGCSSAASAEASGTTGGSPLGNGLLTGLLGYWKMDQATNADAPDATGNGWTGSHFITTGSVAGKINTGIQCSLNAGGFTVNTNIDTRGQTAPFTMQVWFQDGGPPGGVNTMIAGEWDFSGGQQNFALLYDPTGVANMFYSSNDTTPTRNDLDTGQASVNGMWFHIIFGYDGTNKFIILNNGTKNTAAVAGVRRGVNVLGLGNNSAHTFPWPGTIDEIGYWNRALSAADITTLYNAGNGLSFSSFS